MDAARELAQLVEALGELLLRAWRAARARPAGSFSSFALDQPQVERERDEPLLRAVVQVALEPPALGVAGLDDARARRRQLLVRVGVRQRLRDELGEVAQPLLVALGERLLRPASPRRARPTAARRR